MAPLKDRKQRRQTQKEKRDARNKNIDLPGFKGPKALINEAKKTNIDTALAQQDLNAINESGPYGGSKYIRDESGKVIGRETSLSEGQQKILDGQERLETGIQDATGSALGQYGKAPGLDFSGLPSADPIRTGKFSGRQYQSGKFGAQGLQEVDIPNDQTRQRVEDAYFNRSKRLLDKQFGDLSESETANLRARGYQFGGDDYNKLYNDRVADPRQRAYQDAADAAVQAGGAEAQRNFQMQSGLRGQQFGEQLGTSQQNLSINAQNFGQSLGTAQQNMAANAQNFNQNLASRNQGIQEQITQRNQPLQEAATLTGMQRGVTNPNVQAYTPTQVAGTDVLGAGLGMAGISNDRIMHNQSMAAAAANRPPGTDPNEWYQRALFSHMLGQENMALQAQLQGGGGGSGGGNPWMALGSGFASGLGQGLGSSAAGAF